MAIAMQGRQDAADARRQADAAAESPGQFMALDGPGLARERSLDGQGLFVAIGREGRATQGRNRLRTEPGVAVGCGRSDPGPGGLEVGAQPADATARLLDIADAVEPGHGGEHLGLGLFGGPAVGLAREAIDLVVQVAEDDDATPAGGVLLVRGEFGHGKYG